MPHKVFICHSSKDKLVADAACAALEAHRIPCWIAPRDIAPSAEWAESIVNAITDCKVVLLIFSQHANNSPDVRREINLAISEQKDLVPFRIENVLPTGAIKYAVSNRHWLDAVDPPMEQRLIELRDKIARLLDLPTESDPLWSDPAREAETTARAQQEAEQKSREEELAGLRAQIEQQVREEVARKAAEQEQQRLAAQQKAHEEEQARLKALAGQKAKEEAERLAASQKEAESLRLQQEARKAREAAEARQRQEDERLASQAAAQKALEEQRNKYREHDQRISAAVNVTPAPTPPLFETPELPRPPLWQTPKVVVPALLVAIAVVAAISLPTKPSQPQPSQPILSLYQQAQAARDQGDTAKEVELLKSACDSGTPQACVDLGKLYSTGTGVSASPATASQLFQRACSAGDQDGCSQLQQLQQAAASAFSTDDKAAAEKAAREAWK